MDCPAPVNSPDETQVAHSASTLFGCLNGFGFHVLMILLGIARALM
jgi:hypothetical protein